MVDILRGRRFASLLLLFMFVLFRSGVECLPLLDRTPDIVVRPSPRRLLPLVNGCVCGPTPRLRSIPIDRIPPGPLAGLASDCGNPNRKVTVLCSEEGRDCSIRSVLCEHCEAAVLIEWTTESHRDLF